MEQSALWTDHSPKRCCITRASGGLLLDWELAAFGDPSDLARLAVRLQLPDPTQVRALIRHPHPHPAVARRTVLYWCIHQLADAALSTSARPRQGQHPSGLRHSLGNADPSEGALPVYRTDRTAKHHRGRSAG
ncbi:hypothetical protein [Streptomyces sp. BP-8]|uniref:Phosphotransferase n=1 Tax=Streptomyces sirii TaxID=3127701 RepID=A0ABZ2QDZ5_9ACTN